MSDCKHKRIVPVPLKSGDRLQFGRCVECGDDTFPWGPNHDPTEPLWPTYGDDIPEAEFARLRKDIPELRPLSNRAIASLVTDWSEEVNCEGWPGDIAHYGIDAGFARWLRRDPEPYGERST